MSFSDVKMGLKRPESLVINRCLRVAEHAGLSGEETMVLLAYNALCQCEDLFERQLKLSALDIRAPFFMKEPPDQLSAD